MWPIVPGRSNQDTSGAEGAGSQENPNVGLYLAHNQAPIPLPPGLLKSSQACPGRHPRWYPGGVGPALKFSLGGEGPI